ncbi:MAG: molecular chaperone [Alphaproteobacteria bacterium]|nr:molecular chaperone [Alphaproteobacteria bacterium]
MTKPGDNSVQTFQLESSNLRGRIVRLGSVLDDILVPHEFSDDIAHLAGEAATLAALLASMLKYEGSFTLQAQGDGVVRTLVADITSAGELRACATWDPERLKKVRAHIELDTGEDQDNNLAQLLGKGYLAFTVDQGRNMERYQGLVELKGPSLTDCVHHYFTQSEQIGTGIKMAVGKRGGTWRAGAIMVQHLPEQEQNPQAGAGNVAEDNWRRTMILLGSCTDDELLDEGLAGETLLFRLFHEEGVRVFAPQALTKGCRCTEEKIRGILMLMTERDRRDMAIDGEICMRCEFCRKDFIYDPEEIEQRIQEVIREKK